MASFWQVKDGQAIKHVGRPTSVGNISFAIGCNDDTYRRAGLYDHVDWIGDFDPRTQNRSEPRFVVDEPAKAVRAEYDITSKTPAEIKAYDDYMALMEAETIKSAAREKLKEIDIASIRGLREYVAAQQDAPAQIRDYETAAISERAKLR